MSHFTTIKVQVKNKECLVKALQELGFQVEVNDRPANLYGYQGDLRSERAEVVVRRQNLGPCSNDLGFCFNSASQSWDVIISEYDQQYGSCAPGLGLGPEFITRLTNEYSLQATLESARQTGAEVVSVERQTGGAIKIVLRGTIQTRTRNQSTATQQLTRR